MNCLVNNLRADPSELLRAYRRLQEELKRCKRELTEPVPIRYPDFGPEPELRMKVRLR